MGGCVTPKYFLAHSTNFGQVTTPTRNKNQVTLLAVRWEQYKPITKLKIIQQARGEEPARGLYVVISSFHT